MEANDQQYDFSRCYALKYINRQKVSTMALKLIQCPHYRLSVLSSFESLADRELQLQEWLSRDQSRPYRYWDSLALYVYDGLFENCEVHHPEWVAENEIFYDQEEQQIVVEFANFVHEKLYYDNEPDEYYLHDPEWPKMWEGAAKVASLMEANNKKYDFAQCHSLWIYIPYEEWNKMFDKQ
ncbi:MAG: hypothetical protein EOP33_03260 [Rickettsiaceae bacterium]|nr:MAG: hypothetical protein EOP33_03260 [Rickettsiaceae bacterium]